MRKRTIMTLCLLLACTLGLRAQEGTHWQCDIREYEYDMTVYFSLQLDAEAVTDYADYEMAAFIGEECRGVAEIQTVKDGDGNDVQYGYIRIRSNQAEGETVSFKVYRASTEETLTVNETVSFTNLSVLGLPSSPFALVVTTFVPTDPNQDGSIDIFDALAIVDYYLNGTTEGLDLDAADFNRDGVVDMFDAVAIVEYYLAQ